MKYKRFSVVELNDNNRATILQVDGNRYFAEIVNPYGVTIDNRYITADEVKQVIYSKNKEFQK